MELVLDYEVATGHEVPPGREAMCDAGYDMGMQAQPNIASIGNIIAVHSVIVIHWLVPRSGFSMSSPDRRWKDTHDKRTIMAKPQQTSMVSLSQRVKLFIAVGGRLVFEKILWVDLREHH